MGPQRRVPRDVGATGCHHGDDGGQSGYPAPRRSALVLVSPSDGRVCHALVPSSGVREDAQDGAAFAASAGREASWLLAALVHNCENG